MLVSAAKNSDASAESLVKSQEALTEQVLKSGKAEQCSDSLYDLAKLCVENNLLDRAEKAMRESITFEDKLNRPEAFMTRHYALALILAKKKKRAEAVAENKIALEAATKAKRKDFMSTIVDALGTLSLQTGNLDEADAYFKQAFDLAKEADNVPGQVYALVNQASTQRIKKNFSQAQVLLKQALDISEKGAQDSSLGSALINLARVQHDLGNLSDSAASYQKAIDVFKQDLNLEFEADADMGLGNTYIELQQTANAQNAFKQGLDLLKEEPDNDRKVSMLIGLGCAEADLGHFEEAQKLHIKSHDMAESLNDKPKVLDSTLQLGNDFLSNGYPESALNRLLEGEKLIKQDSLDARLSGNYMMAIGRCYKALGQYDSAEKYYDEALHLFESVGDNQSRALALNSLSVLALDNKNSAEFETFWNAAKTVYADSGDKRNLAIMDYNYAQYLFIERKNKEASERYAQALEEIKGTGDKVAESKILCGSGMALLSSGHPQQAMQYYEKALKLADESGAIETQWESNLGLGGGYKALGLNDLAMSHLIKAVESVEKERGHLSKDSFKTNNLDQRNKCYTELVDLYIRMGRSFDALAIAEKGRARAFLDMLSSRKSARTVETFSTPLSSRPAPTSVQKQDTAQLVAMATPVAGTRGVNVVPRTADVFSSTAVSPVNASAPDIDEIKALVKNSKSTVLEYYILPDKIAAWVIDPDSSIHMIPPIPLNKEQLGEKVSLTYEAITHQPKTPEEVAALAKRRQEALRELYTLLIAPVEQYLPKTEESVVTIVPHGPMFMVPFSALISPDGKFLIEKHTLGYTPAIGVMRATQKLEQQVSNMPDRLLALGNPITKQIAFLGTLPYSEKEVQNIAALFGAGNSVVKIGQDANKQTFEELASQFSEVHLATHGLVDEENPMQSSLILAPTQKDDGLLTVKDILAMKEIKAKLVVLSACQTGRGKITGDGVVGLSRAFIIAGTPSVLVSQWNVDDIITEYQMKSFYKSYLAHSGRSKALRQAQLDTIKFMESGNAAKANSGIRANPRYWSAFQLIGESL